MMDVQVEKDLVFAAHDGADLKLDIYRPPHDNAPVTIYLHGGGWRHGDKTDDGARRLAPLSACGITVVAVNPDGLVCAPATPSPACSPGL